MLPEGLQAPGVFCSKRHAGSELAPLAHATVMFALEG